MIHPDDAWAEKKKRGLVRYLLVDGILITGGPFAVILQVVGYFLFPGEAETFGQYFADGTTWIRFFFHGTLFGLIMGFINWRRNDRFARGTKN
jgi:hypothetical protein